MRFGIWIFTWIIILKYFDGMSVEGSSHYKMTYSFIDYSNSDDSLHNGKRCEYFHFFKDSCDPTFALQIHGYNQCYIMSKETSPHRNSRHIYSVYGSSTSTRCDLSKITLRVNVRDHDRVGYNHVIDTFYKKLYPVDLSNYKSSGLMRTKYISGATLRYSIMVKCSSHYYGYKCNNYCKRTYNYSCSKYGIKLCNSGYYGPQCQTYCRSSPKYTCDRLGKRICSKYYYGTLCDKYCKSTISYQCDKNGDKICFLQCGPHGKCTFLTNNQCSCDSGWNGKLCNIRVKKTTSVTPLKPFVTKHKTTPVTLSTTVRQLSKNRDVNENKNRNNPLTENGKIMAINGNKILGNKAKERNSLSSSSNFSPTSMIIIGLLTILCICMIALIIIKKKKVNYIQQPRPVMVYQPKKSASGDSSSNNDSGPYSTINSIKYSYLNMNQYDNGNKKNNEDKYTIAHDTGNNEPIYEQPQFNYNNDDMCSIQTCVTEDPYSGSNVYLVPMNEK